jgi:hypothetical protein
MAATRQQGTFLGTAMVGFTAFPAGWVAGGAWGTLIAFVGLGLMVYSAIGFYRNKSVESTY